MKMVVNYANTSKAGLNRNQLEHAIKRNFGGFNPDKFNPMDVFTKHCKDKFQRLAASPDNLPPTDSMGLIKTSLSGDTMNNLDDVPDHLKMSESMEHEMVDAADGNDGRSPQSTVTGYVYHLLTFTLYHSLSDFSHGYFFGMGAHILPRFIFYSRFC